MIRIKVNIYKTENKYNIIYADPPWRYEAKRVKGAAENHYKTMSLDEICRLPIPSITAQDSTLFLWVTFPQLSTVFQVIKAWGFSYKTVAFTWIKRNKKSGTLFWGLGSWTRSNAEICLLATKGKPKRISTRVHQVIEHPIGEHSKKPDIVRDKIIGLVGELPRIELFARDTIHGWDAFEDEI